MAAISGRERNKTSPFWATGLSSMAAAGQRFARGVDGLIKRSAGLAPYMWPGSGWRIGSNEHSSGRALDIIITANVGMKPTAAERKAALALIAWLQKNARTIGVQWILFSRDGKPRTESWNADRGTWNALGNRGSIPANHVDHIHVYLKAGGAGWTAALDKQTVGSASTGGDVVAPKPKEWDGRSFPGEGAFAVGQKHAAVKLVQERLKEHGYEPGKIDSYWGKNTSAATKRFQQAQGWKGADADGVPGPETWKRLMADPKKKEPSKPDSKPKVIGQYKVTTKSKRLNGRSGPGTNHKQTQTAAKGYVLDIVETRSGWAKSTGGHWYSMQYLTKVGGTKSSGPTKYVVATKASPLRGRSGPGTNHKQTMRAHKGAVLDIVETRSGWAKSMGGHWYSMKYLKKA